MSDSGSDPRGVGGYFFAARQSASVDARLVREGDRLRVLGGDAAELTGGEIETVLVSSRVGSIPRRLTFPDGAAFTTADNNGVDRALAGVLRGRDGAVHWLERFHPRLFAFAVLVLALLFAIYQYGVPIFTDVAVAVTPPSVSRMIGRNTLTVLDRTVLSPSELDPAARASLVAGFRDLARSAEIGNLELNLEFRRGGVVGPNALALPDGTVVITDELVDIAGSDDAVLGALAHEITHVEKRHSLQRLCRAAVVTVVIMFAGGDIGDLTQDILFQGSALLTLSYSRTQETEADARGVELMRAAGRNPAGMAALFERIEEKCPGCADGGWWASHPGLKERIEAIRKMAAGTP